MLAQKCQERVFVIVVHQDIFFLVVVHMHTEVLAVGKLLLQFL